MISQQRLEEIATEVVRAGRENGISDFNIARGITNFIKHTEIQWDEV